VSGLNTRKHESFERALDDFADIMIRYLDHKWDWTITGLRMLSAIFSTLHGPAIVRDTTVEGPVMSDGHIIGKHGAISGIAVLKRSPTTLPIRLKRR
jgi:hypothetical protein